MISSFVALAAIDDLLSDFLVDRLYFGISTMKVSVSQIKFKRLDYSMRRLVQAIRKVNGTAGSQKSKQRIMAEDCICIISSWFIPKKREMETKRVCAALLECYRSRFKIGQPDERLDTIFPKGFTTRHIGLLVE